MTDVMEASFCLWTVVYYWPCRLVLIKISVIVIFMSLLYLIRHAVGLVLVIVGTIVISIFCAAYKVKKHQVSGMCNCTTAPN